jgi:hypothetical protein
VVRIREDTLRNTSVVMVLIKEELLAILSLLGDGNEIKVVEDLPLLRSPVFIMEVVINPHETLINEFRNDGFSN